MFAGTATFRDADTTGKTSLRRMLHNHSLSSSEDSDQLAIHASEVQNQNKTLPYSYPFSPSDEVPEPLNGLYTSSFYAWSSRPVLAVCPFASSRPASSAGLQFSVGDDNRSNLDDVDETPMDDDVENKEAHICPFDPQI